MSARRKGHPCGHRGMGKHCHRCEQADKLERVAETSWKQLPPSPMRDTLQALQVCCREEAKRLRAVPGKVPLQVVAAA